MDPAFFRDFARRCRELMTVARTDVARRQLATWVEEFEQRAEARECEIVSETKESKRATCSRSRSAHPA
jgi:hypothetical protein